MAKQKRPPPEPPPCYAMVHPGLEAVAAEEIAEDLGGTVRKTAPGLVIFRVPEIGPELLRLRTTEDVFLLAWGSDSLTYRAADLESIRHWTAREPDWGQLLRLFRRMRPKAKPTYRLVTQMHGEHGYRRKDAAEALARGLAGKFPRGWVRVADKASLEIWLTIRGKVAVCGVRLSDRSMRHRTYKAEHLPASLRPTIAAAMVRLAGARAGQVVLDPMCGAGTILAEQIELARARREGRVATWGGDIELGALLAAAANLKRLGPASLARWDVARLPLAPHCVDRVVCNPPFGKQLASPQQIGPLYQALAAEGDRALKPGGRAVLLVSEPEVLREAARAVGWVPARQVRVRVLGQPAVIGVWRKPGPSAKLDDVDDRRGPGGG